jgi:peptide/nickel transport system permease protein
VSGDTPTITSNPVGAARVATSAALKGRWQGLRSPMLIIGFVLVGLFVTVAVLAPVLAPYDPHAIAGDSFAHPSAGHLLGTNDLGQDILSQVIWAARYSLTVAVAAATLAVVAGVLVGVLAGLTGGVVDMVLMRAVDVFLGIPGLPLIILITALLGPNIGVLIFVVALAGWAPMARTLRSQTLTLRERGFVQFSQGAGGGPLYVLRRHLVPATGPLIVAHWVDWAGAAIFLESGLAFLGLGDPFRVSWGTILDRAFRHQGLFLGNLWAWWVLPAAAAITLAVIGFTLVGIGLEPVFNRRVGRLT